MSKSRIFVKVSIFIISIIVLAAIIYVGILIHWFNNAEIEMIGKTHIDFFVETDQIVDYEDFIFISDETKQLEIIDLNIREKISNYMKENNLKLKEGHHYITKALDGTYEEYITDNFKFEKIRPKTRYRYSHF